MAAKKTTKKKAVAKKKVATKKKAAPKRKPKAERDIEKAYPVKQFVAKLRRFADALEKGQRFTIQIAGERIRVPADAVVNIEHEREDGAEEVEFQIKWKS